MLVVVVWRAGWKELQTKIISVENGSCDSFGPQCNTLGPGEINFIEVKVKALNSVLTTFFPIETPDDKKNKTNFLCVAGKLLASIGYHPCEDTADGWRLEQCRWLVGKIRLIVVLWLSWMKPFIYMINSNIWSNHLSFAVPLSASHLAMLLHYLSSVSLGLSFSSYRSRDFAFSFQVGVKRGEKNRCKTRHLIGILSCQHTSGTGFFFHVSLI